MGPIGIYIRRHLDETLPGVEGEATGGVGAPAAPAAARPASEAAFQSTSQSTSQHAARSTSHPARQQAAQPASQPVRDLFRDHARSITTGVLTTIGGTAANYIVLFYLSTYAIRILHLPMASALWAAWTGAVVTVICSPLAGMLSDRIGRKRVLWVSRVLLILAVYPAFMTINAAPTVPVLLAVVAGLALLVAFTAVPNIVMLPELFPRAIRATGMSVVYCLGVSIFGGFAQFFATWLIQLSGSNLAPAWYLIGCSLVSLLPLPLMRETAGRPID